MPDKAPIGAEDTTAIKDATNAALADYANNLGPIGIGDMLRAYDGDKHALAEDLAAFKSTKVASQLRSIGKWLNYEQGKPGEQRNALKNKATQAQFRALIARKRPPQDMSIRIHGSIRYSNTARDRTVTINSPQFPIDVPAMLDAIAQGDTSAAYQEIFATYAPSMSVEPGAEIEISFF